MPGAAHSQNEDEFAGFTESSVDASAVPIDVVSQGGASEVEALTQLKWEQKKEQLYLGLILFAATAAVFIEAGTNKGLQRWPQKSWTCCLGLIQRRTCSSKTKSR